MKDTKQMSKAQLKTEVERNRADQSTLGDKLIADGYGSLPQSEALALGIAEAKMLSSLRGRMYDLRYELERIELGYRKATLPKPIQLSVSVEQPV